MEDSAIIVAVIAAVTSVFGAVFSFFSNRFTSKTDKNSNILEQQYLKIISPIHQILHSDSNESVYTIIHTILTENYSLLPNRLWDDFITSEYILEEETDPDELILTPFGERIEELYKILRDKLGYSKIKISKEEKESEQLSASSKPKRIVQIIRYFVWMLLNIALSTLFTFWYYPYSKNIFRAIIFGLLFMVCLGYSAWWGANVSEN